MTARHARQRGPRVALLTATLCTAVFLSGAAALGWDLAGGRLMTMATPSMCPTVCVGSLVAVRPLAGQVHAGELLAFRPPGQSTVFTHRVVKVEADGSFRTKGDAESSPDPWVVAPSDVVGRVSFTLFGLGWWLRALPVLAVGVLALLVARGFYRWRDRRAFERLFGVAVLVATLLLEHPLLSGRLLEVEDDPGRPGWLKGLVVNTGLLPLRLGGSAAGGGHVVAPSRLAWVSAPRARGTTFPVHFSAALPVWAWAAVLAVVVAPVVGYLLYRARRPVEADPTGMGVKQALVLAATMSGPARAHGQEAVLRGGRAVWGRRVAAHRRRAAASQPTAHA